MHPGSTSEQSLVRPDPDMSELIGEEWMGGTMLGESRRTEG